MQASEPAGPESDTADPLHADTLEPMPSAAAEVFGDRLALATSYAELLAGDGVVRGLIGPREPGRLWTRHLLNCAAVTDLFEPGQRIVDVGSGAGLPGLVIAIRRPDLAVDLVEPLQRRVDFLREAVGELGLGSQVRVVHGRAEEPAVVMEVGGASWVVARAVAPLDRLVRWCLPLAEDGGRLALLKGASVADEVQQHQRSVHRAGGRDVLVERCGGPLITPPVSVVVMAKASGRPSTAGKSKGRR